MNSNLLNETAISLQPDICQRQSAQTELNSYLQAQANAIAPKITPLVRSSIEVERIGFTRNASSTPYMVYKIDGRRCCTFIKRRTFFDLVRVLLKLKYSIVDRIRSLTSSEYFGLSVVTNERQKYIPSAYLSKFFERYNQVALEQTKPQQCDCNDLYDMCLHSIAILLQPSILDSTLICSRSSCILTVNDPPLTA